MDQDCPVTLNNLATTDDNISTSTNTHSNPDYTGFYELQQGDYDSLSDYADLNCWHTLLAGHHS